MPQHLLDKKGKDRSGYITIFAVITTISIVMILVLSFSLKNYHSILNSRGIYQSNQAKALANTCGEYGLEQIRDLNLFTGTNTLTFDQGSCTYTVLDLGGANRQINSSGTINNITRKVKILVSAVTPIVTISSWQELADF